MLDRDVSRLIIFSSHVLGLICWSKLIMMNTRMNLGRVLSNFPVIRKFSMLGRIILDNEDILYQNFPLYTHIFKSIKQNRKLVIRVIYLILRGKKNCSSI